jgi:hypothetical protein
LRSKLQKNRGHGVKQSKIALSQLNAMSNKKTVIHQPADTPSPANLAAVRESMQKAFDNF